MRDWLDDHDNRLSLLRGLIIFSVLSTGIHFTHNFFYADEYPNSPILPNAIVGAAIIVTWPLLTACGVYGYRLYRERRYVRANLLIGTYSALGLVTPLHFTSGNPQIPPFFYATIFTDGIAGALLLAFALYSIRDPLPQAA